MWSVRHTRNFHSPLARSALNHYFSAMNTFIKKVLPVIAIVVIVVVTVVLLLKRTREAGA